MAPCTAGTLMISLSKSALFRMFFMFVWGTIALGLLCGLIIVPAALVSWGPLFHAQLPSLPFRSGTGEMKGGWRRLSEDGTHRATPHKLDDDGGDDGPHINGNGRRKADVRGRNGAPGKLARN